MSDPMKKWKIKQTPVALFECPSCKTKWRSKYVETLISSPIVQSVSQSIPEQISSIPTPSVTGRLESNSSIIEEVKTVADNIPDTEMSTGIFSSIRTFIANFFSDR